MYLTLTANPSIDHYVRLPENTTLKIGTDDSPSTNRSVNERFEAGGKGINVAKVLLRLMRATGQDGKDVVCTGFIASFTGKEIVRSIEAEGLTSRFVEVPGHTRINLKLTDGNGRETEINGSGPFVSPVNINELTDTIADTDPDTLFVSGSLPFSSPSETYADILLSLLQRKPNIRVIADCSGEALRNCLIHKPFLIKPNASELSEISGIELDTSSPPEVIKEAAMKLSSMGARNVLVSCGGNGACLLTESGGLLQVPGIKGKTVSTIGAGDTMVASFIFMLDRSGDPLKALEFSNACAACCAFTESLPSIDSLKDILKGFS